MPELARFYGIIIPMDYNDQAPPHIHAKYLQDQALIPIDVTKIEPLQ
jgi:hypothetical protein